MPHEVQPVGKQPLKKHDRVPASYKASQPLISGSRINYKEWKSGNVLSQTVTSTGLHLQTFVFQLRKPQRFKVYSPSNATALWLIVKGGIEVFARGLGHFHWRQGYWRLAYNPAELMHDLQIQKGEHILVGIRMAMPDLKKQAIHIPLLNHFTVLVKAGGNEPRQLVKVKSTAVINKALKAVLNYNLSQAGGKLAAQKQIAIIREAFCEELKKAIIKNGLNNAYSFFLRTKANIDGFVQKAIAGKAKTRLTIAGLSQIMKADEHTIKRSIMAYLGISVSAYIAEVKMLYIRGEICGTSKPLKAIAIEMRISKPQLSSLCRRHFGATPLELRLAEANRNMPKQPLITYIPYYEVSNNSPVENIRSAE